MYIYIYIYIYIGQSYLRLKQYGNAVEDLDMAVELGSTDAKTWNLRALAQRCLKNSPAAIADLSAAVQKEPENVDFYFNRCIHTDMYVSATHESVDFYFLGCMHTRMEMSTP